MHARPGRPVALATCAAWIACACALAACRGKADDGVCRCTPGNVSRTRSVDEAAPMDGAGLLDKLRRHKRYVDEQRERRDIKLFDDELRYAILDFCQPCSAWVGERATMEEMFPLHRLDDATSAVCMGLVLRDGTTAYGDARPRACR
jgi:hypothetical protein